MQVHEYKHQHMRRAVNGLNVLSGFVMVLTLVTCTGILPRRKLEQSKRHHEELSRDWLPSKKRHDFVSEEALSGIQLVVM